jgi:superfamily II DNA/RNA helicase
MRDNPQRQRAAGRPARGRTGAGRGTGGRPRQQAPRRAAAPPPQSELDRALEAAAALPAPEPTTFAALGMPAPLVRILAERGINAPFAIQSRALPEALSGRDVLGKAQTGSGKTLAFGLPALARLASQRQGGPGGERTGTSRRTWRREKAPRGLVLVPTRELAVQVAEVLEPLGRSIDVSVTTVYGGVSIGRQIDRMRRGVDLVVATPGRLIDLLDRGACTLDDIEITVLDEADHMADLGFMPAVTRILDATPAGGQRLLFSATLDRGVGQLVMTYLSDPALCAVAVTEVDNGTAEHSMLVLPAGDKVQVAAEIASRPARTLFFVRTKHGADRLARQFDRAGVAAAAIHGNLNQNQRARALAGFAAGHPRVLVATDVAARGIHVDDIELVVHYDPPNDHKDYLHRSGRTARAGADGMVVALVEEGQVRELERLHRSAGVRPIRHDVVAGHDVVRQIAESGTPVPPAPAEPEPAERSGGPRSRPAGTTTGARSARPPRSGHPGRPRTGPHSGPREGQYGSSREGQYGSSSREGQYGSSREGEPGRSRDGHPARRRQGPGSAPRRNGNRTGA